MESTAIMMKLRKLTKGAKTIIMKQKNAFRAVCQGIFLSKKKSSVKVNIFSNYKNVFRGATFVVQTYIV